MYFRAFAYSCFALFNKKYCTFTVAIFYDMNANKSFFQTLKPGIPKQYLLLVAGLVWTFAGCMLLIRGFSMLLLFPQLLLLKIIIGFVGGLIFYFALFSGISQKHTRRIIGLPIERPCLFCFFHIKSYVMMVFMISMGMTLRKTGLVPLEYLSVFYVTMGTPLLLSAFRFYYNGINYKKVVGKTIFDEITN
jgi:hypothetical protein